jgi:hypothetical protein
VQVNAVTNNQSRPAEGTTVVLQVGSSVYAIHDTDSSGSASFSNITSTPGHYTVSVTLDGHKAEDQTGYLRSNLSLSVSVSLPTATLGGTVMNTFNEPMAGVTVFANGTSSVTTDQAGRFQFNLPVSRDYTLTFAKEGYAFDHSGMQGTLFGSTERSVVGFLDPDSLASGQSGAAKAQRGVRVIETRVLKK